jgi:hypothetical protein
MDLRGLITEDNRVVDPRHHVPVDVHDHADRTLVNVAITAPTRSAK